MPQRLQETPEEKELHLKREKGYAKRLQETPEEKELHLKKAQKKRATEVAQKICEAKGFIEDEQQWLITGSLHELTQKYPLYFP